MFAAPTNQTTRYRTFVFRVTSIEKERPMPRAQQEAQAWEELSSRAQQQAIREFTQQYTAKWRQLTQCAAKFAAAAVCPQAPSGQESS